MIFKKNKHLILIIFIVLAMILSVTFANKVNASDYTGHGVYTGFVNYSGSSDIPSNYIELSTNDINKVIGTDYENRVYFYLPDNYSCDGGDITIGNLNIHKDFDDCSWFINIGYDYYHFDGNFYYYYDYTNGSIISSFNNANDTGTVYVKPKSNGYSITFEENGGNTQTDLTSQSVLPNPLPVPIKNGYTFSGWCYDIDLDNAAAPGDTLSGNVILYAKWILNTYSIIFNDNGYIGVTLPSNINNLTTVPTISNILTLNHYEFLGWYTDNDIPVSEIVGNTMTSNITLYAEFIQCEFNITFNSNGGSTVNAVNYVSIFPNNITNPIKTGYTFSGWYLGNTKINPGDIITNNIIVSASWIPIIYHVRYYMNLEEATTPGSDCLLNDLVDYGTSYTIKTSTDEAFTTAFRGVTFIGWKLLNRNDNSLIIPVSNILSITDDITLIADYTVIDYTYTFYKNLTDTEPITQTGNYTSEIELPNYSNPGYVLSGFKEIVNGVLVNDFYTRQYFENRNVCLCAVWRKYNTLTFNSNGGSFINPIVDISKINSSLPIPLKENCTFGGWYYDSNHTEEVSINDDITTDKTIYAKWLSTTTFALGDNQATLSCNEFNIEEFIGSTTGAVIIVGFVLLLLFRKRRY